MPTVAGRGHGRGRRTINEINMVPFIDVMLVLLIIFMVTAPLITPSLVDLPSVGKAARQPDEIIRVTVGKDGKLQLKIKDQTFPVSLKELPVEVKRNQGAKDSAAAANSAVVIEAEKNVKYDFVIQTLDALQRAGIPRVGLSVQLVN
jgi:biopolymer transport protein TolR